MKIAKEKLINAIYESVTLQEDEADDIGSKMRNLQQAIGAGATTTPSPGVGASQADQSDEDEGEDDSIVSPEQLKKFRDMVLEKTRDKAGVVADLASSAFEYAKDAKNVTQESFTEYTQEVEIQLDQAIFYYNTEEKIEDLVKNKRDFIDEYRKVLGDLSVKTRDEGTAKKKPEEKKAEKKPVREQEVDYYPAKPPSKEKVKSGGEEMEREDRIKAKGRIDPRFAQGSRRSEQRRYLTALKDRAFDPEKDEGAARNLKARKKAFLDPATLDEDLLKKRIGLEDPNKSKRLKDLQEKARTSFAEAQAGNKEYMTEVTNEYDKVVLDVIEISDSFDKREMDGKERVKNRVEYIEKNILGKTFTDSGREVGKPNEYIDLEDMEYIPYMTDLEWKNWTDIMRVKATPADLSARVTGILDVLETGGRYIYYAYGTNRKIAHYIAFGDADVVIGPDGEEIREYDTPERQKDANETAEDYLLATQAAVSALSFLMNYNRGKEDVKGVFDALTEKDKGGSGSVFRSQTYQDGVKLLDKDGNMLKGFDPVSVRGRASIESRKKIAAWFGSKQPWMVPGAGKGIRNEIMVKTLLFMFDPTIGLASLLGRGLGYTFSVNEVTKILDDQAKAIAEYGDILGRMKKYDFTALTGDSVAKDALKELKILKGEIEAKYSDSIEIDNKLKKNGLTREVVTEAPESLLKRVKRTALKFKNTALPVTDDPFEDPVGPIDPDDDTLKSDGQKGNQAIDRLERAEAERKLASKQQADADKALSQAVGGINKTKAELDAEKKAKGDDGGKKGKGRTKPVKVRTPGRTKVDFDPSVGFKRDDDFTIFEQKQNAIAMGGGIDFGQMKKEFNETYDKAVKERLAYSQTLLTYYTYIYAKGMQDVGLYSQYAVTLGFYTNLYADAMIKFLSTTPAAAEEPETPEDVDVDGSDDPIAIKGKVPPQATVKERVIRVSKNKLIDIIFEHLEEQKQTVDITKDQLVALVAQEAFKQINRKK